jgi:CrcB protein
MGLALGVMLLGGLGAVCRYLSDLGLSAIFGRRVPWGTMCINIFGSGLGGLVIGLTAYQHRSPTVTVLLLSGFLGGFTTASTIAYEAARLAESGRRTAVVGILAGTMFGAIAAGSLGLAIGIALR